MDEIKTQEIQQNTLTVEEKQTKETKRIKSIDRFRGFCVFCMLVFQFLKNFPSLGFLSRLAEHSLSKGIVILPGMTLADIIAPAFIFATWADLHALLQQMAKTLRHKKSHHPLS